MADATVTLGINAAEFSTGIKKAATEVDRFSSKAQQSIGKIAGKPGQSGGSRAGGVALQVQDIAVQAQMGAAFTTILAQQGSQVASVFGPKGAIVGGLIAIGAILFSVGYKAAANFGKFREEANKASEALGELSYSGNIDQISTGMKSAREETSRLGSELEKINSRAGYAAIQFGRLFGGPNAQEKAGAIIEQQNRLQEIQNQLGQTAIEISAKELQITELRAEGKEKEADEIQRQLELYKEIERIRSSSYTAEIKRQLIDDANALSEATKKAKELSETLKEAGKSKKSASADIDGDGIISKREQRRADIEAKRAERKANSIKGFSRNAAGLAAFGGLEELAGMDMLKEYGVGVGQRFSGSRGGMLRRGPDFGDPAMTFARFGINDKELNKNYNISDQQMLATMERLTQIVEARLTVD